MRNKIVSIFFISSLLVLPLSANILSKGDFNGDYETSSAANSMEEGKGTLEEYTGGPQAVTYSYDFEDGAVPSQWVAEHGALANTEDHFMGGDKSLNWTSSENGAICKVSFSTPFETSGKTNYLNIHNLKPIKDGLLEIEYLDAANTVKKKAVVTLDFKGWRDINRAYDKDFDVLASAAIASVRFKIIQKGTPQEVKLCFDDVNFQAPTAGGRIYSDINWVDFENLGDGDKKMLANLYYINTIDIPITTPTAQELQDLGVIKQYYPLSPVAAGIAELRVIRPYIDGLAIKRNADGSIKGGSTITIDMTPASWKNLSRQLEAIAYVSTKSEDDKERFNDFLDLIIDQGLLYKFNGLTYSDYGTVREFPKQLLNILPVCSDEQRTEILRAVSWITEYGKVADPDYIHQTDPDYIYNLLGYVMTISTYAVDPAQAVQLTKAASRYFSRCTEPTPGGVGFIKPDGCGFHHTSHYNNYMYSYKTFTSVLNILKGTCYRIDIPGYEGFKKAIISAFLMANRGSNNGYTANSLCGRHPLVNGGNQIQYTKGDLTTLISIGEDVYGHPDNELLAAYSYFFPGDATYGVPPADYEGFYQFNYSPIGVYRYNNWVATMRTPTTRFWGAEIYDKTNRFGRYQSHGTLEIVYDNGTPSLKSGLPMDAKGWDWNVIPGATTVHCTAWSDLTPSRNITARFDQWTKTTNFSGALTFGKCGMYGAEYNQYDWNGPSFVPTNLVFKKSVYAFDGILISLGSNIGAVGSYSDDWITATNLFQSIKTGKNDYGTLTVNGQQMNPGDPFITDTSNGLWLVTPEGTGYYVPKGNDKVTVKFGDQTGPDQNGSDMNNPSTVTAAKAYIEHGVKVSDKSYQFVAAPGTTPDAMQALAARIGNDGGDLYKVEVCNSKMHILTYKPQHVTAYCLFGAATNISAGKVRSAGSEMLLMQKDVNDSRVAFAVANPNLRPINNDGTTNVRRWTYDWHSTPTNSFITIEGKWYPLGGTDAQKDVTVVQNGDNTTTISFSVVDGEPIYFTLDKDENAQSGINKNQENKQVYIFTDTEKNEINLNWGEHLNAKKVTVYSINGQIVESIKVSDRNNVKIKIPNRNKGVYIIRLTTENESIDLKTII